MKNCIPLFLLLTLFLNSCDQKQKKADTPTPQLTSHLKDEEVKLQKMYQKIAAYHTDGNDAPLDSLETENIKFETAFLNCLTKNPESIRYPFDSLKKENIHIVISKDSLFKIYSWDTSEGGTMVDFVNIFQYQSGKNVQSKIVKETGSEDDYIPFYSEIFTLKNGSKTYYLAVSNGIYSSKDASQSIAVFSIENNQLKKETKLFKTKEGFKDLLQIDFDFFSVVDRPERPLQLIKYDDQKKQISLPVVTEEGNVTNEFTIYTFTGQYFE
ncbi:hypothetical protein [Flavobacterium cerinum]|uniref:Lipoprotein n=1 Tax=Flavobacterium cerinum TaxID=2502784 RepID=A0ABY5IRN9_9FLAO|nr:hypothetical protein [Flavobacterium cerinum]UUC44448.1 hypothetical protein NOX80_12485 [Flavobacterium cerinum]